ncbi:MAG: hypothetical protein NVS9B15_05330 [Acidobacteriaceae bacterium]
MSNLTARCAMNLDALLDEYYLENRHKLLELAAFLDRLDRARDGGVPENDFRVAAMRRGLEVLCSNSIRRARDIQLVLSDLSDEARDMADRKMTRGAFNPASGNRR